VQPAGGCGRQGDEHTGRQVSTSSRQGRLNKDTSMSHVGSPQKAAPVTSTAAAVPVVQVVIAMTAMNEKQQQNARSSRSGRSNVMIPMIDMTAHNGLRGVCALWVVLAHCLGNYVAMNGTSLDTLGVEGGGGMGVGRGQAQESL